MGALAFLDTETDGLHPQRRAWEVAIVRREPDGHEASWHLFLPIELRYADPHALRIGGYWDRHPHGRAASRKPVVPGAPVVDPADAARVIFAATFDAHLVGMTPSFDADVLARLLTAHGLRPEWNYHLIDVAPMMLGWLAARGRRPEVPYSSTALSDALGVAGPSGAERHTALGDVSWVMRIWDRMSAEVSDG